MKKFLVSAAVAVSVLGVGQVHASAMMTEEDMAPNPAMAFFFGNVFNLGENLIVAGQGGNDVIYGDMHQFNFGIQDDNNEVIYLPNINLNDNQ